jgi:hypothetical protein
LADEGLDVLHMEVANDLLPMPAPHALHTAPASVRVRRST